MSSTNICGRFGITIWILTLTLTRTPTAAWKDKYVANDSMKSRKSKYIPAFYNILDNADFIRFHRISPASKFLCLGINIFFVNDSNYFRLMYTHAYLFCSPFVFLFAFFEFCLFFVNIMSYLVLCEAIQQTVAQWTCCDKIKHCGGLLVRVFREKKTEDCHFIEKSVMVSGQWECN